MSAHLDDRERGPIALTDGTWQRKGLVMRWVPEPRRLRGLIACPTCRARIDQHCTSASGKRCHDHANRVLSRRCACGAELMPYKSWCPKCAREARREAWRKYGRNRRAAA